MKIAVLADIHGNLPALQTVVAHIDQWRPDEVVVAGDVVNRGPRPLECLQIIEEKKRRAGWLVVRGNHEDYVINHTRPNAPRSGPEFEIYRTSYWTLNQLNGQVGSLKDLPFQISLSAPDGGEIRTVHASMHNNRDGIFPDTTDEYLRQQIAPPPAAICVGHTHQALTRFIDDTLVVNAGSVGMPFDGDNRAAYAQLTWHNNQLLANIIRLEYDNDRMDRDFFETGFAPDAGALTSLMLVEFRHARPYLHLWMRRYQEPLLSGEISIENAVDEFIASLAC
jgi:predicted phosphodiesterase